MIEKPFIDFGHCSVNEHKDCLVYLENQNQYLAIDCVFTKVPNFFASLNLNDNEND